MLSRRLVQQNICRVIPVCATRHKDTRDFSTSKPVHTDFEIIQAVTALSGAFAIPVLYNVNYSHHTLLAKLFITPCCIIPGALIGSLVGATWPLTIPAIAVGLVVQNYKKSGQSTQTDNTQLPKKCNT